MNDPQDQIRVGSHNEEKGGENVDDSLSRRDEQDAQSKKARTASERAQNFEEQLVQELREQVRFLQSRICLNENLPAKVAQLEQCLDGFRAIGWAQLSSQWRERLRLGFPVSSRPPRENGSGSV